MHIHLDPLGGVAGDMFIAAVLDAFPDLTTGLLQTLRDAGLPPAVSCRTLAYQDHTLSGTRFVVDVEESKPAHAHTAFSQIRTDLRKAPLKAEIREHALGIFTLLAQAEAKVHGRTPDEVTFHEVGARDSIADIVGAAYLIDALDADSWSSAPLPIGAGRVQTAHGLLPIPAPATTLLLEGFVLHNDGVQGERITPTGAAILRYLGANAGLDGQARRLHRTGIGFGSRQLPGISNILRLLVLEDIGEKSAIMNDEVALIGFEVDDQSPEDLAVGLGHLRELPEVLDVVQIPALGKKGRLSTQIQVMAQPERLNTVIEACFRETTTIGLRYQTVTRAVLPRRAEQVTLDGRPVRVKVVERPGGTSIKPENDDVADAGDRLQRQGLRRQIEDGISKTNDE